MPKITTREAHLIAKEGEEVTIAYDKHPLPEINRIQVAFEVHDADDPGDIMVRLVTFEFAGEDKEAWAKAFEKAADLARKGY